MFQQQRILCSLLYLLIRTPPSLLSWIEIFWSWVKDLTTRHISGHALTVAVLVTHPNQTKYDTVINIVTQTGKKKCVYINCMTCKCVERRLSLSCLCFLLFLGIIICIRLKNVKTSCLYLIISCPCSSILSSSSFDTW